MKSIFQSLKFRVLQSLKFWVLQHLKFWVLQSLKFWYEREILGSSTHWNRKTTAVKERPYSNWRVERDIKITRLNKKKLTEKWEITTKADWSGWYFEIFFILASVFFVCAFFRLPNRVSEFFNFVCGFLSHARKKSEFLGRGMNSLRWPLR